MANETPLRDDDGSLKMWLFSHPGMPNYQHVATVPLRRDEAIRRLREQRPPALGDATHATLAEQDLTGLDAMPITPHGTVRVQFTPGEEINRMLAPMMGLTINLRTR